jgi:hypothetical protein
LVKPISATKRDATIEITGEEMNHQQMNNDQVVLIPRIEFNDGSQNGQVIFFILYRMHSAPGSTKSIWKPVYKSEIKYQDASNR